MLGGYRIDCIPNGSMTSKECLDNEAFGCMLSQKKTTMHPVKVGTGSLAELMMTQGATIPPNPSAIKRAAAAHCILAHEHESSIQNWKPFSTL